MLRARMHPRRLVTSREVKDSVGDQNFMISTELRKQEAVSVPSTNPVAANDAFPGLMARTY